MCSAGDPVFMVVWRELWCACMCQGMLEAREVVLRVGGRCLGMKNIRDRLVFHGYMLGFG